MSSGIQVISIAADILVMAVMARLLVPYDYGVFAAALLYIAICGLMREIGVSVTFIQLPSLSITDQRTGLTIALLMAIMVFVISQLGAGYFADFMNIPELETVVRVLSFMVLIQAFAMVSQGLLLRDLQVVYVSAAEVSARLLSSVMVGVTLAFMGFGYWALVIANMVEATLFTAALVSKAKPSLRPSLNRASLRLLLGRGSGFAYSRIMSFVSQRASYLIIGRFADAASLGIYSRASKLMTMPHTLYNKVADRVVFPAMAKVQHEPLRMRSAYLKGLEITALFGIPLATVLYLLAADIITVLLGSQWAAVIPIFSVLAPATYLKIAIGVSSTLIRATAAMRQLVIAQTVNAVLMIGGVLYAVQFGLEAVAWAIVFATSCWFSLMTFQACRIVNVNFATLMLTQRYGLIMALGCAVLIHLVNYLARAVDASSWVVLVMNALAFALVGLALIVLKPRAILGPQGTDMANQLYRVAQSRIGKKRAG